MKILEVQNLSKIYGKEENQINALKNVSFGMEKGEFAAVVGESGSGKKIGRASCRERVCLSV